MNKIKIISNLYSIRKLDEDYRDWVMKGFKLKVPLYSVRCKARFNDIFGEHVILTDLNYFYIDDTLKDQCVLDKRMPLTLLPKRLKHKNLGAYKITL